MIMRAQRKFLPGFILMLSAAAALAANAGDKTAITSIALPLAFQANDGQAPAEVRYLATGRGYNFFVTSDGVTMVLEQKTVSGADQKDSISREYSRQTSEARTVRVRFAGAERNPQIDGVGLLTGKANYFLGSDPAKWRREIPMFSKVRYGSLYPGIDLVCYGNDRELEYDFVVAAHASPAKIAFEIEGADKITIDRSGDLILKVGGNELRQHKPVIYQTVSGGVRKDIKGGFRLLGKQTVGFQLGDYDANYALIIDPVLSYAIGYSSFVGGASLEIGRDIVVDQNNGNNIYIAGETRSSGLAAGSFSTNFVGGKFFGDGFVAKYDSTGSNLLYFVYLGGSADDSILGIAIDAAGNAYVTGVTDSTNFPLKFALSPTNSAVANPKKHFYSFDAFAAKILADGSDIVYSTCLGGTNNDQGIAIAVDTNGVAYVAGITASTNFPATNVFGGREDAFVAQIKFDGAATSFGYHVFLGGSNVDHAESMVLDKDTKAVFITGYTTSPNFPNTPTNLFNGTTNVSSEADVFVTKLAADGKVVFSSPFGGGQNDYGFSIAQSGGSVFVTGTEFSTDFPVVAVLTNTVVTNTFLTLSKTSGRAFVLKLSSADGIIYTNTYSVIFGGKGVNQGWGIAADAAGNAFVTGITTAKDFPTNHVADVKRQKNAGSRDVFVTAFNPDATALLYSLYVGGKKNDLGYAVALDSAGNAWVVGQSASPDFPQVNAPARKLGGKDDAFILKISPP